MSSEWRTLYRLGGAGFIVSGVLFLVREILDLVAGAPPSTGNEILAWVASGRVALAFSSEVLFFATVSLVPAVAALYVSLIRDSRAKTVLGCGVFAVTIPVLAVLDIVHGRLVYPVYGIRVDSPAIAELVVGVYYGGLHAVNLLFAGATFVLSLAMLRGYGKGIAFLGIATSVLDVAAGYPFLIGPVLTLVCQLSFTAWFVAVGAKLAAMR